MMSHQSGLPAASLSIQGSAHVGHVGWVRWQGRWMEDQDVHQCTSLSQAMSEETPVGPDSGDRSVSAQDDSKMHFFKNNNKVNDGPFERK